MQIQSLAKKPLYIFILIIFIINIFAVAAFYNQKTSQEPKVIFLNVGQGDSTLINSGKDNQVLIDGGDGSKILEEVGKYMPYFDKKIELIIMTHPDKDHMGGLVEVLKYYDVGQILETGIACETAICKEWDGLVKEKNIPVAYAKFGENIKAGGGVDIKVLFPFESLEGKKVSDDNDTSMMLKVFTSKNSFLLTGDAGFKEEKELLGRNINIAAKILKVSHHGSKNATSNDFLSAVNPEKAIISVGKNSYGHPAEELLNRLKNINTQIHRTDAGGDLVFE